MASSSMEQSIDFLRTCFWRRRNSLASKLHSDRELVYRKDLYRTQRVKLKFCARRSGRGSRSSPVILALLMAKAQQAAASYLPTRDPSRLFSANGRPMKKPQKVAMRLDR